MAFPYFVSDRMWKRIRGNDYETLEVNCELGKRYKLFSCEFKLMEKAEQASRDDRHCGCRLKYIKDIKCVVSLVSSFSLFSSLTSSFRFAFIYVFILLLLLTFA